MALVEDVIFRNPLVTEKLAQMFNNKKCCDTVFLVNETQFHASSHLITVSNAKLDSIVNTHFENCGDRYIRIGPVKHNDSFLFLLKYMYGIPINFTQMDKAVMCEVLSLCELYEFNEFSKELKSYFAKFDCIDIESLVVLLNTSKKYCLKELYEKCTIFAYKNTDQFVSHASFVDLQYHVLLDLIKSDRFCTKEVDILRRTLNWHSNNLNLDSDDLEDNVSNASYQTVAMQSVDNRMKDFYSIEVLLDKTANLSINNTQDELKSQHDSKCSEVVKTFSENILKVLLSLIRINKIPTVDLLNFLKLDEGQVYQQFVLDSKYFSNAEKARKYYNEELDCYKISEEVPDQMCIPDKQTTSMSEIAVRNEKTVGKPVTNSTVPYDNQREDARIDVQQSKNFSVLDVPVKKTKYKKKRPRTRQRKSPTVSYNAYERENNRYDILNNSQLTKTFSFSDYRSSYSTEELSRAGFNFRLFVEYNHESNDHFLKTFLYCKSDDEAEIWECSTEIEIEIEFEGIDIFRTFSEITLTESNHFVEIGDVPWYNMDSQIAPAAHSPLKGASAAQYNSSLKGASAAQYNSSLRGASAAQYNSSHRGASAAQYNSSLRGASAAQYNSSHRGASAAQYNSSHRGASAAQYNSSHRGASAAQYNSSLRGASAAQYNSSHRGASAAQYNSSHRGASAAQYNSSLRGTSAAQYNSLRYGALAALGVQHLPVQPNEVHLIATFNYINVREV